MNQGNLIGRTFYLLNTTPSFSENKTLKLLSHSGKEEQGTVDLSLTIKVEEERVPLSVRVREYTQLLRSIVNLETEKVGVVGSLDYNFMLYKNQ